MKKRRWAAAVLASVTVATTGGLAFSYVRGARVETALVRRSDIEQHVVASGRVRVPNRVQIAAQIGGLVVAVGAAEGQRVKAGDLLVQLDDLEARAAVAESKAAVGQAAARVEQLRKVGSIVATEGSRQAEANLARAESELARVERLVASGSVAPAELEDARRAVAIARAQRSAAAVQQIAAGSTGADSRVALSALLQSQAALTGANLRLAQTRLTARQDGVVLDRSVEAGDVAQAGRTLLVMAVEAASELVIEPDERNLATLRLGQRAVAAADAFPDQPFAAELTYLAPAIDPQRGSVEVRLRVPAPPAFLRPELTVSVDLTVASRRGALVVPSGAVRGAATPTPAVFVVAGARLERRDVKLGIRGEGSTEILEGVEEGAEVVVGAERPLAAGQRVRAAAIEGGS